MHPQLLRMATLVLVLGAAAASLSLAYSYVCAGLECSRDFVPFRQAVLQWAGGEELQRLTDAFAQWEVDHFVITRLLLPAVAAMLLLTGYAFGKPLSRHAGWYTLLFAVAAAALATYTQPLEQLIDGTGVTTAHTTELFIILDVLLLWCIWPILMTLGWCIRAWRIQHVNALRRTIPVGLLHLGVVLVIVGATVASTLDSSVQRTLELPHQYGELLQLGANLELSVDAPQSLPAHDGAVGGASLLAVSEIHYSLHDDGEAIRHAGILYRDQRSTSNTSELSSFRQRCMVLDYRFARALDRPGHVLHPVIDRGWLADWQLWMPAEPPAISGKQREVILVARRFPLMSVLWTGLALILFASFVLLLSGSRYRH